MIVLAGLLYTLNPLVLLSYSVFLVFGLRVSYTPVKDMRKSITFEIPRHECSRLW